MAAYAWADEVLGFRSDTGRETGFHDAEDQHDFGRLAYAVQVGERAGWTVLVEPNGYAVGSEETVALSAAGTAVSLFWTVNADMGLTLAERLTGVRLDREWVLEAPRPTWTTAARLP